VSFEAGQTVGDYQIIGVLGAGGMGEVYKVKNEISDRIEAMKILLPDLASQSELANRFLREIKVLASLDHPNIASLRTALRLGNQLVMIMELVEGTTLGAGLRHGPLPASEAVDYICQILSALSYAHARGIVHRDIKPSNMMLTPGGVVKLMDFGIARAAGESKLTVTGSTLGSLYYMSPEQVEGRQIDARSDLYSLGVSLYELVTARHPFEGDTSFAVMKAHIENTPIPPIEIVPNLPAALNEIILMSMAKDPEKRYQTADEFREVLQNIGSIAEPAVSAAAAVTAVASTEQRRQLQRASMTGSATPPAQPAPAMAQPAVANASTVVTKSRPQVAPADQLANASESQTPVPVAPTPMPVPRSYRAFYIALGSALTILIITLTAMRLPMLRSSQPEAKPAANTPATSVPSASPSTSPSPSSALPSDSSAAPASSATTGEAPASKKSRHTAASQQPDQNGQAGTPSSAKQAADAAAAAAYAENEKAIEELQTRFVPLSARANAVKDSFENLRRQQAAAGYSPDSSISTPLHAMEMYLNRADAALSVKDAAAAKKNMDLAEAQLSILERRFGR
jgi:serine/threonine-protein kinase